MTTLKAICAATVLALSLSIPAYADGGEVHDPGKASCVTGLPADDGDSGSTGLTTMIDSDSLSAVVNILWTVASIF